VLDQLFYDSQWDSNEESSKFPFDQATEGQDFVLQTYLDCLLQVIKTEAALRVQDPFQDCDRARKVATLLYSSNHAIVEAASINERLKSLRRRGFLLTKDDRDYST
jgi:hypothetical protein